MAENGRHCGPAPACSSLLSLPELEPTPFRYRKERFAFTGDQRIDDEPELIHKPGVDRLAAIRARAMG